jgi:hypothetical protein
MENKTVERISGALFLVLLGVAFLLNNFKVISLNWGNLLFFFTTLWPLFIIFAGIKILFTNFKFKWIVNLSLDIIFDLLFFAFLVLPFNGSNLFGKFQYSSNYQPVNQKIVTEDKDYTNREYLFEFNAGEFFITDEENSDYDLLATGELEDSSSKLEITTQDENDTLKINSKILYTVNYLNWFRSKSPADIDFSIGNKEGVTIPTNIDIKLNAGSFNTDIKNTSLRDINLKINAGSGEFKFGSLAENIKAEVNAGSLKIFVPSDQKLELSYEVNAGSIQVTGRDFDESFDDINDSGTFSSNDENSSSTVMVNAKISAGSLEIILE